MATTVTPHAEIPHDVLVPAGTNSARTEPGDILPTQREASRIIVRLKAEIAGPDTALPSEFLFGALRNHALKLRKPIPLRSERSHEGISVIWDEGQEFGFGETFSSAIDDFAGTIAELYIHLVLGDEPLSSDLTALRDKISQYIEVRPQ
jgi:hypothetical protein